MATKKSRNKTTTIGVDEEWRVEQDLRTLVEAEAIEKDPKRFAKVQALAKKRMMEVAAIAAEGKGAS